MSTHAPFHTDLPPAADPALRIIERLRASGFVALLAGGCVRDLLLGRTPQDFDVATDAAPADVRRLFRPIRLVGAQFGVALVHSLGQWIEVARFRSDGDYLDGRRPETVRFATPQEDAQRRDFTINGLFLDPHTRETIDYVGGRADLVAGVIRAIGDPHQRFAEDHLRLLRAVRFAARLGFTIEPATAAAVREHAARLADVAMERVHDELMRMLNERHLADAVTWLDDLGLLRRLPPGESWDEHHVRRALRLLRYLQDRFDADESGRRLLAEAARVRGTATFETGPLAMAILLLDRQVDDVHRIARALLCSNEERETAAWLVAHQRDLLAPSRPDVGPAGAAPPTPGAIQSALAAPSAPLSLAQLKRRIAHPDFPALVALSCGLADAAMRDSAAKHASDESPMTRAAESAAAIQPAPTADEQALKQLAERLSAMNPAAVAPAPLITGDDLLARGVPQGPHYRRILDDLYTRQLDEVLTTRSAAEAALLELLQSLARGPQRE